MRSLEFWTIAVFLCICISYGFVVLPSGSSVRHLYQKQEATRIPNGISNLCLRSSTSAVSSKTSADFSTQVPLIRTYQYDGWNLTYRYKPPVAGYESAAPLVLIHPIGIGLSAWFWDKFMEFWEGGAIYAPNLIGCGLEDGGDAWDPDDRGLSVPLGWVQAVEALIQEQVLSKTPSSRSRTVKNGSSPLDGVLGLFQQQSAGSFGNKPAPCIVVAQGGLAPVGLLLASRNPSNVVSHLILTSPPTWKEMTMATPQKELDSNYKFYRSPLLGKLAFAILESPWAVRFFSNLFLFQEECDDRWVELATSPEATTSEARPPVMVFNSGFLQHRSYEEEIRDIEQPTLVISGTGDKRVSQRQEYMGTMKDCTLVSLEGTNVVPWENPEDLCETIQSFCAKS